MQERRQFVRLDTRIEVSCDAVPSGKATRMMTKNIGGGGICFFGDEVLPPNSTIKITMRLPDIETPISFTAEVVWSEAYEVISRSERRRSVEIGARFIEISPGDHKALMQYVILGYHPASPA